METTASDMSTKNVSLTPIDPPSIPNWEDDVRRHTDLARKHAQVAFIQTELTERIRAFKKTANPPRRPGNKNAALSEEPHQSVMDEGGAFLCPSVSARSANDTATTLSERDASATLGKYERELKTLERYKASLSSKMREFEARILTKEPEGASDARALLNFIAGVLALGHKIEAKYLSDVLDDCAFAIANKNSASLGVAN